MDSPGWPKRISCSLAPVTCLPGSSMLSTQALQKKSSCEILSATRVATKEISFFSLFYIDISVDFGSTCENQLVSNTTAVASGMLSPKSMLCPHEMNRISADGNPTFCTSVVVPGRLPRAIPCLRNTKNPYRKKTNRVHHLFITLIIVHLFGSCRVQVHQD
jgi:hypothetical protein